MILPRSKKSVNEYSSKGFFLVIVRVISLSLIVFEQSNTDMAI